VKFVISNYDVRKITSWVVAGGGCHQRGLQVYICFSTLSYTPDKVAMQYDEPNSCKSVLDAFALIRYRTGEQDEIKVLNARFERAPDVVLLHGTTPFKRQPGIVKVSGREDYGRIDVVLRQSTIETEIRRIRSIAAARGETFQNVSMAQDLGTETYIRYLAGQSLDAGAVIAIDVKKLDIDDIVSLVMGDAPSAGFSELRQDGDTSRCPHAKAGLPREQCCGVPGTYSCEGWRRGES